MEKLIYNYPLVVTSLLPLKSVKEVVGLLELAKKARKQVLIFAPDLSDSVKSTLIYNNKKKVLETGCICIPNYSSKSEDFLKKISDLTESYLFGEFSDQKLE